MKPCSVFRAEKRSIHTNYFNSFLQFRSKCQWGFERDWEGKNKMMLELIQNNSQEKTDTFIEVRVF